MVIRNFKKIAVLNRFFANSSKAERCFSYCLVYRQCSKYPIEWLPEIVGCRLSNFHRDLFRLSL